jgi:transcriptional regulator with XRE-family HTH domain
LYQKRKFILEFLGQILQKALKDAGVAYADAAAYMGVSETNLYRLFKKDSFEVSYLKKAASLLNLPLSHFLGDSAPSNVEVSSIQTGSYNQSGNRNSQKIKVTKAPAHELAQQLDTCQRDNESLKSQLALANALVAAKDETITLLRASITRPTS